VLASRTTTYALLHTRLAFPFSLGDDVLARALLAGSYIIFAGFILTTIILVVGFSRELYIAAKRDADPTRQAAKALKRELEAAAIEAASPRGLAASPRKQIASSSVGGQSHGNMIDAASSSQHRGDGAASPDFSSAAAEPTGAAPAPSFFEVASPIAGAVPIFMQVPSAPAAVPIESSRAGHSSSYVRTVNAGPVPAVFLIPAADLRLRVPSHPDLANSGSGASAPRLANPPLMTSHRESDAAPGTVRRTEWSASQQRDASTGSVSSGRHISERNTPLRAAASKILARPGNDTIAASSTRDRTGSKSAASAAASATGLAGDAAVSDDDDDDDRDAASAVAPASLRREREAQYSPIFPGATDSKLLSLAVSAPLASLDSKYDAALDDHGRLVLGYNIRPRGASDSVPSQLGSAGAVPGVASRTEQLPHVPDDLPVARTSPVPATGAVHPHPASAHLPHHQSTSVKWPPSSARPVGAIARLDATMGNPTLSLNAYMMQKIV
jgi:hypothetical protein